jgi:hypothetical protein
MAIDNLKKMFDDKNIKKALLQIQFGENIQAIVEARALMINKKQKEQ